MTDETDKAALARWDAYWQHGFLTSCADAFDGNYGGSIAVYWQDVFAQLANGAVILDLCTGNGAVAALAAEHALARDRRFRIVGIDLAAIEPSRALADRPQLLEQVEFFPRTSATSTPLDDASVDQVCGQYALEYTPLEDTVREMARVLRPGGRGNFILHHDQSVILTTTREEMSHRALLEGDDTILDAAQALATRVAAATTVQARQALSADAEAEACRLRLNERAAQLAEVARTSPHPEILYIAMDIAKKAYTATLAQGLDAGRALLQRGRAQIQSNFARLDDLTAAAMTEAAMEQLGEHFRAHNFEVAPPALFSHDNSLIGWSLCVTRGA